MLKIIEAPNAGVLSLGRQGENLARRIAFKLPPNWDMSDPAASVQLVVQRAGESAAYPVMLSCEDGVYYWDVTATDTGRDGYGLCELRYLLGDVLAKSMTWLTNVAESISDDLTEPPDAAQNYLSQVMAEGAKAAEAADRAESAILKMPYIQDGVWMVWDFDQQAYVNTGVSAGGGGGEGTPGGYYTPTVSQPDANTMRVSYTPSQEGMAGVEQVDIVLPQGSPGSNGKTAYQYAQDGGYTGTEAEFAGKLASGAMLVVITDSNGTLSADKSYDDIYNAILAGTSVLVSYKVFELPLIATVGSLLFGAIQCGNDGTDAMVGTVIIEITPNDEVNDISAQIDIPKTLPNPNALTFTGAVTGSYDGSAPLSVEIPSGGGSGSDISLGLTGATVGQIAKITAVDDSGKPTAWEAVDIPSGSGGERWRLVRTITLEENVTAIDISEDNDGNPFALKKIRIYGNTLGTASGGQLRINVSNKTDDRHSILGPYPNFRGLDTTKRYWVAESECVGIIGGKGKWSEWYNTPDTSNVGAAYVRAGIRSPELDSGQSIQDRVEFLHIFSNTSSVEFAAGSYIELWGVDA